MIGKLRNRDMALPHVLLHASESRRPYVKKGAVLRALQGYSNQDAMRAAKRGERFRQVS